MRQLFKELYNTKIGARTKTGRAARWQVANRVIRREVDWGCATLKIEQLKSGWELDARTGDTLAVLEF